MLYSIDNIISVMPQDQRSPSRMDYPDTAIDGLMAAGCRRREGWFWIVEDGSPFAQ